MKAIKSCNQCWASYTRESWGELPIVLDELDQARSTEHRRCRCGAVLEIERAWLLHDDETDEELDDPTELYLLPNGSILLMWPAGDGSYNARKVSGKALLGAVDAARAIEGT